MIKVQIQITGSEKIIKAFDQTPQVIMGAVEEVAFYLRRLVFERTPVGRTGSLIRGWSGVHKYDGFSYGFGNVEEHAEVVELGLFKGEGLKTIKYQGRIYSRQAIGGMIKPLLDDPQVLKAVEQRFISALDERMGNA